MLAPRRTKKTCCCQPPAPGRHWPRLDCAARVVLAGVFLPGVSFLGVRLSGVFEEAFRFLLETDAASSQGPSPLSASSSSDTASLLFLADVPSRLPTSRFNAALVGVFCTPFPARDVSSNRMHSGGTPRGDSAPPSLTTRHGRLPARTLILCATLSATCTISPRSTSSPFAARMCVATPCSVAAPAASDTDSAAFSSASVLLAVQQCRHAGVTRASVHSRRARSTRHCRASPAVSASSATRWHSGQVPRAAPSTACTRERANRQPRLSAGPCGAHALPEGQGTRATGQRGVRMCGGHLVQPGALGLVGTQLLDLVAAHGKAAGMRRRLNTRAQVIQLRLQPPSSRVRRLALAPLHHLPRSPSASRSPRTLFRSRLDRSLALCAGLSLPHRAGATQSNRRQCPVLSHLKTAPDCSLKTAQGVLSFTCCCGLAGNKTVFVFVFLFVLFFCVAGRHVTRSASSASRFSCPSGVLTKNGYGQGGRRRTACGACTAPAAQGRGGEPQCSYCACYGPAEPARGVRQGPLRAPLLRLCDAAVMVRRRGALWATVSVDRAA